MKKIIISLFISILFLPKMACAYLDVPQDSPYYYAIEFLRRAEVISDKTPYFKPDSPITRAEFIRYLVELNNREFKPKTEGDLPFADTKPNAWYSSYFEEAINLGILSDREKTVRPYGRLRVNEAVELLFHSRSIPIPKYKAGVSIFKDIERSKKIAPMMIKALELELIKPIKKDYVGIYRQLTKSEAVQMIYQMELVTLGTPIIMDKEEFQGDEENDFKLQKIISAWKMINTSYVEPKKLDAEKLSGEAIRAMLKTLDDPYSVYLDELENSSFSDDLDGEIEGIGAMVGFNDKKELTIITPLADSPAQKAGLKSGDIIRLVNEVDIKEMSLEKAVSLIKGPKGTTVTLRIERDGTILNITIVRAVIQIKALEYETKDNGQIMYIHLLQFSQNSPSEFADVIKTIEKNGNIKGIILDLRDDPGGLLDAALKILNHFIKPQSAAVKIKYSTFDYTQFATGEGELAKYPIAVLINKGSASASEIVAGALQDYKIATVIGEKSFGKGTVQELNYFKDNSSIKLTIAKWLTPLGQDIQANGIKPDVVVQAVEGQDTQLERALQEIQSMINARQ